MRSTRRTIRSEPDDSGGIFNDVLFNMLGMFLLIVIAAMTAVGVPDVSLELIAKVKAEARAAHEEKAALQALHDTAAESARIAEASAAALQQTVGELRAGEQELRSKHHDLQSEHQALQSKHKSLESFIRGQDMDVVFVIDATASMGDVIERLKDTIDVISRTLPKLARLRVSIVCYRRDVRVYPLTEIKAATVDGGRSQNDLRTWLTTWVVPINGLADVDSALLAGMRELSIHDTGSGRQCLALLGDTGPFELIGPEPHSVEPQELVRERELVATVRGWVKQRERRAVVAIFNEAAMAFGSEGSETAQKKGIASRDFFRSIAADGGTYSGNPARLLADLLDAMIAKD